MALVQIIQQLFVADLDVPMHAIQSDRLGGFVANGVEHPAKRVEQALGVAFDGHTGNLAHAPRCDNSDECHLKNKPTAHRVESWRKTFYLEINLIRR